MNSILFYFDRSWPRGSFGLFSFQHNITLFTIVLIYFLSMLFMRTVTKDSDHVFFRYSVAITLLVQELLQKIWFVHTAQFHYGESLPFHMCGFSVIMCAFMLINKNRFLFEINYFWGLGGALQALLTPDIGIYSFPHFRFFQFFVSHGFIIWSVIYMLAIEKYSITFRSFVKMLIFSALVLVNITWINLLTEGNYFYICRKPPTASLMDIMGPWPFYLIPLFALGIVVFFLLYLPWFWINKNGEQV